MKEYLVSHGIQAWDGHERERAFGGRYAALARNVRLTVRASDAAHARALLENPPEMAAEDEAFEEQTESWESSATTWPPDHCPRCGSTQVRETGLPKHARWALNVLFLGLPLIFRTRTWVCPDCDWDSYH